jgi:Tfp pilus assembly protein PilO
MNGWTVWLRRWFVWAIPGTLVLLNVLWLAGVRSAVLGRGSLLTRQVNTLQQDVQRLENQKRSLTATQDSLQSLEANISALRDTELGSMRERLVPFLVDVVRRAEEAGLKPERIAYQVQKSKKSSVVHFAAAYSLTGGYEKIRKCIYLLEDSPQFVVVESLGLRGDEQANTLEVSVTLTVGTYFSDMDPELMKQLGVKEVDGDKAG